MTISSHKSGGNGLSGFFDRIGVPMERSTFPDLCVLLRCRNSSGEFRTATHTNREKQRSPDSNWRPVTMEELPRYGVGEYLRSMDIEVCHPQLPVSGSEDEIDWERLPNGYHNPGSCVEDGECLLHELCGGPNHDGQLEQHHICWSSLPEVTPTGAAAMTGVWRLTIKNPKPEYVALLVESMSSLNASGLPNPEFTIGNDQTLCADLTDAYVINPLYSADEVDQATKHPESTTVEMATKVEFWRETVRDRLTSALSDRLDEIRAANGGEINGN